MITASRKYVAEPGFSTSTGASRDYSCRLRAPLSGVTPFSADRVQIAGSQSSTRYLRAHVPDEYWNFAPTAAPAALAAALKLTELSRLGPNWNDRGADAPNAGAIATAREALRVLFVELIDPERVTAMPEGGVAIYCFGRHQIEGGARARYARIALPNEEVPYITLTDRISGTSKTQTVGGDTQGLSRAAEIVAAFLGS